MELVRASDQQPARLGGADSWASSAARTADGDDYFGDYAPDLEGSAQANRGILVYFQVRDTADTVSASGTP